MKTSAVPQGGARLGLVAITALVGAVLTAMVLAGSASAAPPVGKDGKIHACYKAKGKRKGAMRIVSGNKRCRRGERRVAWIAAGAAGRPGQPGARGGSGPQGPAGAPADPALLEARIAALTLKIDDLEGLLCDQTALLTDQTNLLRGAIGGLSLNNVLSVLGGLLNIPALPPVLPAFDCS